MSLILDIFNNRAFAATELTEAINLVPNTYGRLQQLGLFVNRPSRTRSVAVQYNSSTVNLLPSRPWGGTPSLGLPITRNMRQFLIPHFPHNDMVTANDVQDMIGSNMGTFDLMSAMDLLNDKLTIMQAKHTQTWEFMRWGALNGQVYDADGVLLLDIYAEFGITQQNYNIAMATPGALPAALTTLKRYYENNLLGQSMSGIHVFCSPEFWDDFVKSPDIVDFITQFRGTAMLGEDYRNSFTYYGITFEEHMGQATDVNGGVHKFIAPDTALAVPVGTDVFRTFWAPADFLETVNRPGLTSMYAKQKRMDFDRGIEIHTQSNPLPLVTRPQLVVKLTST
jgi:hypothetical protein